MKKRIYLVIVLFSLVLLFSMPKTTFAQTNNPITASTTSTPIETNLVNNADLGIGNPLILPGNPFYGLKTFWHHIRFIIALKAEKKAELKMKYASEKLAEIQALIKKGNVKKDIINKTLDKYQEDTDEVTKQADKIKDLEKKEKFTQKYIDYALKQQIVLQRLSGQVPPQVFAKIQEKRQAHLKKFSDVMEKISNKEKMKKNINDIIKKITDKEPGSRIRMQEILNNLVTITPKNASSTIEIIRKENLNKTIEKIKKMHPAQRKKIITKYLNAITDPASSVKISDDLEKTAPELKSALNDIRENLIENFIQKKPNDLPNAEKEKILNSLINNKTKHLEILQRVQEKIEKSAPQQSAAPIILKNVIDAQKERINKSEENKKMNQNKKQKGIEKSKKNLMQQKDNNKR